MHSSRVPCGIASRIPFDLLRFAAFVWLAAPYAAAQEHHRPEPLAGDHPLQKALVTITVDDLKGTDVTAVDVDLAGTLGGSAGDGQPDRVIVNGTAGDDSILVNGGAGKGGVAESGLAAGVSILHSEAANDRLEINTLAGNDTVDSTGLAAGALQLLVDGALVP